MGGQFERSTLVITVALIIALGLVAMALIMTLSGDNSDDDSKESVESGEHIEGQTTTGMYGFWLNNKGLVKMGKPTDIIIHNNPCIPMYSTSFLNFRFDQAVSLQNFSALRLNMFKNNIYCFLDKSENGSFYINQASNKHVVNNQQNWFYILT